MGLIMKFLLLFFAGSITLYAAAQEKTSLEQAQETSDRMQQIAAQLQEKFFELFQLAIMQDNGTVSAAEDKQPIANIDIATQTDEQPHQYSSITVATVAVAATLAVIAGAYFVHRLYQQRKGARLHNAITDNAADAPPAASIPVSSTQADTIPIAATAANKVEQYDAQSRCYCCY